MLSELAAILDREEQRYEVYRLLKRSFGSDDRILDAIRDTGSAAKLLRNIGLTPKRKPRGHSC